MQQVQSCFFFIKGAPRSASKLSIDPINSHASYFGKSIGSIKRSVPINRTVSSNWNRRVLIRKLFFPPSQSKSEILLRPYSCGQEYRNEWFFDSCNSAPMRGDGQFAQKRVFKQKSWAGGLLQQTENTLGHLQIPFAANLYYRNWSFKKKI